MTTEQQLEQLNHLIAELEYEMWYNNNIHTDAPHRAHKVKGWNDQLKEQAAALHIKISNQTK